MQQRLGRKPGNKYPTSLLSSPIIAFSQFPSQRKPSGSRRRKESTGLVPTVSPWGTEQGRNGCGVDPGV